MKRLLVVFFAVSAIAAQSADEARFRARLATNRACPHCDLRGADFSAMDLTEANLAGADLTNAKLAGAKLDGAIFSGANLTNAVLDRATISRANFAGANLTSASLRNARLTGANLQFAILDKTDFTGADRAGAVFGPARERLRSRRLAATSGAQWVCGNASLASHTSFVYVSPDGADAPTCGTTPDAACATIATGLQRCAPAGCAALIGYGMYTVTQPVELRDGVDVYGGCVPPGTLQAESLFSSIVASGDGVIAVRAKDIHHATLLYGFQLSGSTAEDSTSHPSITAAVMATDAMTFENVSIVAGRGGSGAAGADGKTGERGADAVRNVPGKCCNGTKNSGGLGGDPANCCMGWSASELSGPQPGALGGLQADHAGVIIGIDGQGGFGGACSLIPGLSNPSANGALCCATLAWVAMSAFPGERGQEGGGGGGGGVSAGGSSVNYGGGGGGGGAGGYGGAPGWSGGPSFAMVLLQSNVNLKDCQLYGGRGGDGGKGGQGGFGGGGGSGAGPVRDDPNGPPPGHGGDGGAGGTGSGGGGGNSGASMLIAQWQSHFHETNVRWSYGASGTPGDGGQERVRDTDCYSVPGVPGFPGPEGKVLDVKCPGVCQ